MRRKTILFVAEAVTLAHVARPLALARLLDPRRFAVQFACAEGYEFCFQHSDFPCARIGSISSQQFLHALAHGKPVYSAATLASYVEEDLGLLEASRPDLVVGDFRLSLSISARLAGIPYAGLINAYWSPSVRQHYTVPQLPLTAMLPIPAADLLFRLIRPAAFASHTVPLNRVRRRYGLPSLGFDLRRIYTDADHTLYPDIPELFPGADTGPHQRYLGPLIWSPPMVAPDWFDSLPDDKPVVYVTLGSSGQGRLFPLVLQALAPLPLTVLGATAGNVRPDSVPANAYVASYLPGEEAARRASLVICNGGSPTSQQALAQGVPLIGIAGNLDQFLNMHGIVEAGAGILLRADRFDPAALQRTVQAALGDAALAANARKLAASLRNYPAGARFMRFLAELFGEQSGPHA